jgi:hypothetical protein
LAGSVEAAHHRALGDPQGTRGLLVGEPRDVDGDDNVTEVIRKRGYGRVDLSGLHGSVWLARTRIGDEIRLIGQRARTQSSPFASLTREKGVAERAQEVAEIVLVAQEARSPEHARIGLLNEILGVLAGTAERPGGSVEPVEVVSDSGGVEWMFHRRGCRLRPIRHVSIGRE